MRFAASDSALFTSASALLYAASISANETLKLSVVSVTRSNRADSSIRAASPRARTSAMMSLAARETSSSVSRAEFSSAENCCSKSASRALSLLAMRRP